MKVQATHGKVRQNMHGASRNYRYDWDVSTADQKRTTFMYPYSTYAYRRMPFGLCNAPANFQRCMSAIFHGFCEDIVEIFMDDFFVYGTSFDNCLHNLNKIFGDVKK